MVRQLQKLMLLIKFVHIMDSKLKKIIVLL